MTEVETGCDPNAHPVRCPFQVGGRIFDQDKVAIELTLKFGRQIHKVQFNVAEPRSFVAKNKTINRVIKMIRTSYEWIT